MDDSEKTVMGSYTGRLDRFMTALLGPSHGFVRVCTIDNGGTYSRQHSHSTKDEYYVVLEGSGHLRFNNHIASIGKGNLLPKPIGPDAYSQLLADSAETLRILDIEITHETCKEEKDVTYSLDHKEIYLHVPRWENIIQSNSIANVTDSADHYSEGYERLPDGNWKPESVPGMKERC